MDPHIVRVSVGDSCAYVRLEGTHRSMSGFCLSTDQEFTLASAHESVAQEIVSLPG